MLRRWFRIAGLGLGIGFFVPLFYVTHMLRLPNPWPRRFLGYVGRVSGLRIEQEGSYRRDHVLFVANHASWLDIMAIGGTTGAAFVAKAELSELPFIHWLARMNDTIFIQRQDRRAMQGKADEMRTALLSGRSVALFPEATTHGGKDLLPFRASLFSALYPPIDEVLVQPIVLDFHGLDDEIRWGDESGGANARRILSRPGTIRLTMRFLEPLRPGTDLDRKSLARQSRDMIMASLNPSDDGPPRLYAAE